MREGIAPSEQRQNRVDEYAVRSTRAASTTSGGTTHMRESKAASPQRQNKVDKFAVRS